jgi:hypothetical protein
MNGNIPLYEWKNSHRPADAELMVIAERELGPSSER